MTRLCHPSNAKDLNPWAQFIWRSFVLAFDVSEWPLTLYPRFKTLAESPNPASNMWPPISHCHAQCGSKLFVVTNCLLRIWIGWRCCNRFLLVIWVKRSTAAVLPFCSCLLQALYAASSYDRHRGHESWNSKLLLLQCWCRLETYLKEQHCALTKRAYLICNK